MIRTHLLAKASFWVLAVLFVVSTVLSAASVKLPSNGDRPRTGRGLYRMACAACHGVDGTGAPSSTVGFDTPLPDFTDCQFGPREADEDWAMVIRQGGPARGFSKIMPAFAEALTDEEIDKILAHVRTFCPDEGWPRGELNLPRAMKTTKAYPEDELVLTTTFEGQGRGRIANKLIYEQRLGKRSQYELILPFGWSEEPGSSAGDTDWQSSVGDLGVALKHVMLHSIQTGSIVSVGGELFFPTGNPDQGFGADSTVFEPFLAYGQLLPADFFVQFHTGLVLPFQKDNAEEEVFWRCALGRTFTTGLFGRAWSPMVEFIGAEEMVSGSRADWDIIPQMQVTLSTRQHVRLCAGAKIPLNDRDVRDTEYMIYLLWDWFDGAFHEGW